MKAAVPSAVSSMLERVPLDQLDASSVRVVVEWIAANEMRESTVAAGARMLLRARVLQRLEQIRTRVVELDVEQRDVDARPACAKKVQQLIVERRELARRWLWLRDDDAPRFGGDLLEREWQAIYRDVAGVATFRSPR